MSEISDRIKEIRSFFCDGDNTNFAKKLGISTVQASALCTGSYNPGPKAIENILDAFPQINKAWLTLGEGVSPMLTPTNPLVPPSEAHRTERSKSEGEAKVEQSNIVTNHGDNNTINNGANSPIEMILRLYEERIHDKEEMLKGKDETINTLRYTVETLCGEVEQLRAYVKLTSTKYIEEIERMRATTNATHDLIKQCSTQIGFKHE